jgi:hypothetical protein
MELDRLMSINMPSVVSGCRYRPQRLIPIAEKEPRRVTCEASYCRRYSGQFDEDLKMVTPKQLTLLTASIVAAGLFLVQPARALTVTAQPYLVGSQGIEAIQPIAQRRCYVYRDGRRVYRPCPPRRHEAKRKSSRYGTSQNSGYYKPWSGIQLCAHCPTAR